ncbi:ADP-ribosylglycohydrolase family protein [Treponema sp. HNW]|uniref:ADP-ribosylglycohydrolase family protein n=1 Tax=Treponema sp. HNW TaxID=3116654 RepID=UPI003D0DBFBF
MNTLSEHKYLEKIYAGFLGMNAGIRLGAPVEPTLWTRERIKEFYGTITDYVKPFKNFAADDDANGPVYFLRALEDFPECAGDGKTVSAADREAQGRSVAAAVADAWLNYTREGIGMFWWGGYGISTEHTAYLNLLNGICAPRSGSSEVNGKLVADQIGGQIFIDTWGLVNPSKPERAAFFARAAASVSHDEEGLEGAAFIAACIAKAFDTADVFEIIDEALKYVHPSSVYYKVVTDVLSFQKEHGDSSWEDCLDFLHKNYGYDKYRGVCHIIPNAGVCVMALIYGKSCARGIEIATMAGWDTDCNAGNVGTILGVAGGIEDIPGHYRKPINDFIVLSGISGYLNILDIPSYARYLYSLAFNTEKPAYAKGELFFDFSLPGSTHGFRLSDENLFRMKNTGKGLEVLFDRLVRPQSSRLFYKSFYRRNDFDDERYMPVFSPTVYPGQTVDIVYALNRIQGEAVIIYPYVRSTQGDIIKIDRMIRRDRDTADTHISFAIPQVDGALIDEIGLIIEGGSPAKARDFGVLTLKSFAVSGKADYYIDFKKQYAEFASITPFSFNRGAWTLEDGRLNCLCLNDAEAFTGNYFMRDVKTETKLCLYRGDSALVSLRVQGARRGYYAGFDGRGAAILLKNGTELKTLARTDFKIENGKTYGFSFSAAADKLCFSVDGETLLEAYDKSLSYGMTGLCLMRGGRCSFDAFSVSEKP